MAHIVASSDGGPRGSDPLAEADRNSYGNLILLCPNHHEEIDAEADRFPSEALRRMKSDHEEWVGQQLAKGPRWSRELSTIDYLNVPRVLIDPAAAGMIDDGERGYLEQLTTLRDQGFRIGSIALVLERVFQSWNGGALELSTIGELGAEAVGARVSFEETFRTKNMTGSDKQRPGFELAGDLDDDPHLYVKRDGRTIYLPLDPRWVTTSTAFVTFTSGIAPLAGVGLVRAVESGRAIVSPLVVGAPPLSGAAKQLEEAMSRR
jgi:hypothetical protein